MKRQGGYTAVEVTLYLAISASLLLLLAGLQVMVSRQRFQDTMTTLRTTIQSEFEEVRSGINSRLGGNAVQGCDSNATAPGAGSCLMIGKLIRFNASSSGPEYITINYIVATKVPTLENRQTDEKDLRASELKVIGAPGATTTDTAIKQQTVKMQWGGQFAKGGTIPDSDTDLTKSIQGLAILRSPYSGAVLVFAMTDNTISGAGVLNMDDTHAIYNVPMALLIKNNQSGFPGAAVCIDRGQTSAVVRLSIPINNSVLDGPTATNLRSTCSL